MSENVGNNLTKYLVNHFSSIQKYENDAFYLMKSANHCNKVINNAPKDESRQQFGSLKTNIVRTYDFPQYFENVIWVSIHIVDG